MAGEHSVLTFKRSSKKTMAQKLDTNKSKSVQNINLDYFLNQLHSHKSPTLALWMKETSNTQDSGSITGL